jgi:hypothetical protein
VGTKVKNITTHKLVWPDYNRIDGQVLELEAGEEAVIEQKPVRSTSLKVVHDTIEKSTSAKTVDDQELGGE